MTYYVYTYMRIIKNTKEKAPLRKESANSGPQGKFLYYRARTICAKYFGNNRI